jgi:parvulin-like peptidyl-prolyl isomerase
MLKLVNIFMLLMIVLLTACNDEHHNSTPVVASSGNANLHLDELKHLVPDHPSLLLSSVQIQNLIQRWAEEELVYQQALSEDYNKNPAVEKLVNELIKNYTVASYLKEKVDDTIKVSDEEVGSYYEINSAGFVRLNNFYNINVIVVDSNAKANEVRRKFLNGDSFESLVIEHSLDASKEDGGKLGWVTLEQLPTELASRVRSMSPNKTSRPIKTVVGYYLVQLVEVRKKDGIQTLEEVFDLIHYRIKARKREESYRQLINQLKENSTLTINWSFIDSLNVIK